MLKQAVENGIALANHQDVVLEIKSILPVDASAQPKKVLSLENAETLAFQTAFEKNTHLLSQRLKSNQESAKQFNKVTVSVPNLVLNSFHQLRQDTLPLVVAMIAQVYHQVESYTDDLIKALKDSSPTSDAVRTLTSQNPVEKNYFFLPYHLVRTLLNFDSIDDDFEANKFARATRELREFFFPLYFNRDDHATNGEQYNLLTSLVGKLEGLQNETINVQAFENCFYWVHDKKEYMAFTIAPDFRNLLLTLMGEVKDGSKLRQVLPYTRIDWHFLHYLPQRNNLRQMYLFIKSNIYNNSNLRVQAASFEYSLDDLKRFMGVDEKSHYADNDSHFVRDKIRKVVAELEKTPGCEYNISISKRNIKTPGGFKQQMIKFDVEIKRSFVDSHRAILRHIKTKTNVDNFKNDWLIISCIRYCNVEQLCARIDQAYGKFLGLQKKAGISKKFDHLAVETQISRFLSDDLQKYWQELAAAMLIENPLSSHSRLVKKVAEADAKTSKIFSSPAAHLVQTKKRGRPRISPSTATMPKLSKKEQEIYDQYAKTVDEAKVKKNENPEDQTNTVENNQLAQDQEVAQALTKVPNAPVQQDLLEDQQDQNVIVFPKDQVISIERELAESALNGSQELETDYRIDSPANFSAPPPIQDSQWDSYTENDVRMQKSYDDLEYDSTFIVNVENLLEHLQPVNGNTEHFAWVEDYLSHLNDDDKSEANSIFYDLFTLTAILNEIEHDNKQFQSRSIKYIDLYREKLNIVLQTLFKFYGTYEQRNDQSSVQSFFVEKTAEILFESSDMSADQRMFTKGLFVQLAKAVETGKTVTKKVLFSLRGQCVAYPFSE